LMSKLTNFVPEMEKFSLLGVIIPRGHSSVTIESAFSV